jgi:hypothetical protein
MPITEFTLEPADLPHPVISVKDKPESNIVFYGGPNEILKITEDGFYVRGVKVEADEKEAASVYKAFKQFLVHHALTRSF